MSGEKITLDNRMNVLNPTNEWTSEENQIFRNALVELDPSSPEFYENVAYRIPWKSVDEVKEHFHKLVVDGIIREPDAHQMPAPENNQQDRQHEFESERGSSVGTENIENRRQRRKPVPWTKEEHELFLAGLDIYGKGSWKEIAENCVTTRTASQVASHAQKFFARQSSPTPIEQRRSSIHDISSYTISCPSSNFPSIPDQFPSCNIGQYYLNNPNIIFPPQTHAPHGSIQNHNSSNNGFFVNPFLISPPQIGFSNIGYNIDLAQYPLAQYNGVQNFNNFPNNDFSSLAQSANLDMRFPSQNDFSYGGIPISQPHNFQDFSQNINQSFNSNFAIDSGFAPPSQDAFPDITNEIPFAQYHNDSYSEIQNPNSNQNVELPSFAQNVDSNLVTPPQDSILNIEDDVQFSYSSPSDPTESFNSDFINDLLNFDDDYDSACIPASSNSSCLLPSSN